MRRWLLTLASLALSCGGHAATSGPRQVDIPAIDGSRERAAQATRTSAPASGLAQESPFPPVARFTLPNGLAVAVVTSHARPLVEARLLVRAGQNDGPTPGVATLTAEMLRDGGTRAFSSSELLRRVETLGANLRISTDLDATVLALPLAKEQLSEGLALLAQVTREPRFDEGELRKRKARATDEAEDRARANGSWAALHLVFCELFPEKSAYRVYGLLPGAIAKIDGAALRDFHRRYYVPKAATLVLAGDLDEPEARALAERHFGAWTGGERPAPDRLGPRPPAKLRVVVAHRPRSVQSEIFVALLGPARRAQGFPAAQVALQALALRDKQSMVWTPSADVFELAAGEEPVLIHGVVETSKTSLTTAALLESASRMTSAPPSSSETEIARGHVSEAQAMRLGTVAGVADLVVKQDAFGLPDGYWDAYRKELRKVDAAQVDAAARAVFRPEAVVVVAGDADVIAPELTTLGDVTVVDPEKEFKTMRSIPQATK